MRWLLFGALLITVDVAHEQDLSPLQRPSRPMIEAAQQLLTDGALVGGGAVTWAVLARSRVSHYREPTAVPKVALGEWLPSLYRTAERSRPDRARLLLVMA
jgi:hypothetical protein